MSPKLLRAAETHMARLLYWLSLLLESAVLSAVPSWNALFFVAFFSAVVRLGLFLALGLAFGPAAGAAVPARFLPLPLPLPFPGPDVVWEAASASAWLDTDCLGEGYTVWLPASRGIRE